MKELAQGLLRAIKNRTIQAALIGVVVAVIGWFVAGGEDTTQINQNGVINTVGQVGDNNLTVTESYPEPTIEIRRIKSINNETEKGLEHYYRLTLSNSSNDDVQVAVYASKNASFKLLDFSYDIDQFVVDNGRFLSDLDAWVLTDRPISESDIKFVVKKK